MDLGGLPSTSKRRVGRELNPTNTVSILSTPKGKAYNYGREKINIHQFANPNQWLIS